MTSNIIPLIKQRLKQRLPGENAQNAMAPSFRPSIYNLQTSVKAGVMILLYPNPEDLYFVLIKRPEYQGVHGGQISLPGGKSEPGDKTVIETALRETQEEIGVPITDIEILGQLTPLYIPVSEFSVYPIVGYCAYKPCFVINRHEVQYLIETDLLFLLNPHIKEIKPFTSPQYTGEIPFFNIQDNHVWGATAMILNEFLEILNEI